MKKKAGPDSIKIDSPFLDRRVKLLPCQRERIFQMHHKEGYGIRPLTRIFKVDRRLIQFICFPERHQKNLELREARGGSGNYYRTEKHKESMRRHRTYKREILARREKQ